MLCPGCNQENDDQASFCRFCGQPLRERQAAPPPTPAAAPPPLNIRPPQSRFGSCNGPAREGRSAQPGDDRTTFAGDCGFFTAILASIAAISRFNTS